MNKSINEIKIGAIISYIAIFFNIIAGLIYTPWMIEQIGRSEYGLYTLAMSLISFFAIDFGLGSSISRFLSRYIAEKNSSKISDFLGITYKLYFIIDVFIFVILVVAFCFVEKIYIQLTPEEINKFRVVFAIGGLFSVTSFPFNTLNGILISHEKFIFIKVCDLINKALIILLMVVSLLLGFKLYALVIVNAVTGLFIILLKLMYINKNINLKINFNCWNKDIIKELFGFSIWTTIISIAQRFIFLIAPSILAMVSGSLEITLFSVASVIEGYVWTFSNALNGLFLPRISKITMQDKNEEQIEELMIKVGRIQLSIIGLIIGGFIVLGKKFMILWMGESYQNSYYITILLILPSIITLTQDIANTTLIALNEIKYRAVGSIITAVTSFAISIVLSSKLGAIGSAIAIFMATCLGNIIWSNYVYYRILNINIWKFFKRCHGSMMIPIVASILIGSIINSIFFTLSWTSFIIDGAIYTLVFIILIWNLGFNNYEKELFSNIFKKIVRKEV